MAAKGNVRGRNNPGINATDVLGLILGGTRVLTRNKTVYHNSWADLDDHDKVYIIWKYVQCCLLFVTRGKFALTMTMEEFYRGWCEMAGTDLSKVQHALSSEGHIVHDTLTFKQCLPKFSYVNVSILLLHQALAPPTSITSPTSTELVLQPSFFFENPSGSPLCISSPDDVWKDLLEEENYQPPNTQILSV